MLEHADRSVEIGGRLEFRVLGPVRVLGPHGAAIDVGGSKPRLVLVQLLLSPNRAVSTDALVDALWGENPPPTARRSLQSHVAKLRAALGGDSGPVRSLAPGYVLTLDDDQVDLWRSEALAHAARAALLSDPRLAHQLARQARQEWTSEPLGDLAEHYQLVPQRRRLDKLWLDLVELELDAELAVGDTAQAMEQLESLVIDRPGHEPFWARLMTAYYRLGRQSDALHTFQRARSTLLESFGIDPSPELQRLETAVLGQTADLIQGRTETCPYKGLASYQLDDADVFYGRDDLIAEILEAVRAASFVVVVGSSGAGKSSVLRAGLVKAVEARRLGSLRTASVITPGATPLRNIYQASTSADLVIVDQFEELFTLTVDAGTQREFVRLLLARVHDGVSRVVISLRADFYGHCTRIPQLAAVLAQRQVVVGPLSEQELRAAITKPAEQAGLIVAPELVDTIAAEASNHTGALPLVSHALVETWHRRSGDRLTLEAYREAGSIAGAIARTAERVYSALQPAQRVQAEHLLLRLVEPGEGTEHARRLVPYQQLEGSSIDRQVIDLLVEARLLTAGADGIEVAHEALITAWPRLNSWIDDDRDGILMHRHLTSAATSWAELGRDEGELYRGARLSAAISWVADAEPDLSDLERDFVDAAVGVSESQLHQQIRANRRLRILVAASVAGLMIAAAGTVLAISKAKDADRGRASAEAAQLVVTVRSQTDLAPSATLELAVEADRKTSTPATKGLLLDVIARDPGATARTDLGVLLTADAPISSNGGILQAIDNNVLGVVIDPTTLATRVRNLRPAPVAVVDTGSQVLGVMAATLETVDLETGRPVGPPLAETERSSHIALSADGTTIAIAFDRSETGAPSGISLYDVASGRRRLTVDLDAGVPVADLVFSPTGRRVLAVVGEGHGGAWDTTTGMEVWASPIDERTPITRVAMSSDDSVVALGRQIGRVEMWRLTNFDQWVPLAMDVLSSHGAEVTWIDFDSTGRLMVSTSRDGVATVWDTTTGNPVARPRTFAGSESAKSFFRPDSETGLVTIDNTGRAWEWDTQRDVQLLTTVSGVNLAATVATSPATQIFTSSSERLTVYSPSGGTPRHVQFDSAGASIVGIAASADGTRFAVVYADGRLELRDAASGDLVTAVPRRVDLATEEQHLLSSTEVKIALSRDGTRVAFPETGATIEVVDDQGEVVYRVNLTRSQHGMQGLDLNDDGSQLVVSTTFGGAIWYDLDGLGTATLAPPGTGFDAQFVSNSRVAFVGRGVAQVVDVPSGHVTKRFALGADVARLALDDTGRLLATAGSSGLIQLWDAATAVPIGAPLQVRTVVTPLPIRFSPDGHYLLVGGSKETTWINVWTADWPRVACGLITDPLSPDELARYLGASESSEPCA